jgi:hypothetical protein
MQIKIPRKIILTEIALSIIALILFIAADYIYRLEKTNPIREYLTDPLLFMAIGGQILFTVLIIISYFKRHQI